MVVTERSISVREPVVSDSKRSVIICEHSVYNFLAFVERKCYLSILLALRKRSVIVILLKFLVSSWRRKVAK